MLRLLARIMIFLLIALAAMPWLESGRLVPMLIGVFVIAVAFLQVIWQWLGRLGMYGVAVIFFWFVFLDQFVPAPAWSSFGFGDWPINGPRAGLPIATIVAAFVLLFIPRKRAK
jgi:hypothetical protein